MRYRLAGDRSVQAVLFACSHNSVRSPMAEALLRYRSNNALYVQSCGLEPRDTDGFAIAAMAQMGLDISDHRPTTFEDLNETSFDLVISLSPEAHNWAVTLTDQFDMQITYWPTYDPTFATGSRDQRLAEYIQSRDHIDRKIAEEFI